VFGTWGFVTTFYVSKLNEISFRFAFFIGGKVISNGEFGKISRGIMRKKLVYIFMRKLGGPLPKLHVVNNSVYNKRTLFGSSYWKEE